jgi:hypothetical protein
LLKDNVNTRKKMAMKAGIIFTGTGPVLILTKFESLIDPSLIDRFNVKNIKKFIGYEVPLSEVKLHYGNHYDVVMEDLKQDDALRVVDEDGDHVLENFSLRALGNPVIWE